MEISKNGISVSFNRIPTRDELERLSIDKLLLICRFRRYNRKPLKECLIDYIISLGEIKA